MYACICIYVYVHTYMHTHTHICIYVLSVHDQASIKNFRLSYRGGKTRWRAPVITGYFSQFNSVSYPVPVAISFLQTAGSYFRTFVHFPYEFISHFYIFLLHFPSSSRHFNFSPVINSRLISSQNNEIFSQKNFIFYFLCRQGS